MKIKKYHTCYLSIFCSVIVALLVTRGAWAAGIYKWIDSDGNVHYSSQPSPATNARQIDISPSAKSGSNRMDSLSIVLRGLWYGSLQGTSYRMHFSGNTMRWDIATQHEGSVYPIFEASWKDRGGDIEITYINHHRDRSLVGEKALIRVINKTSDALTLQFPDNRVYSMSRSIRKRRLGREEKKIIGRWIRKSDNAELLFKSGSFTTTIQYTNRVSPTITERGNWNMSGETLSFTYTSGPETLGRQGTSSKFRIMLLDQHQLILKDLSSGQQVVLDRKISR